MTTSLFDFANEYTLHSHKQKMLQKTISKMLEVEEKGYTYLPIITDSNINKIVDHILTGKLHFLKLHIVYNKIPHTSNTDIKQITTDRILTTFNIEEVLKKVKND